MWVDDNWTPPWRGEYVGGSLSEGWTRPQTDTYYTRSRTTVQRTCYTRDTPGYSYYHQNAVVGHPQAWDTWETQEYGAWSEGRSHPWTDLRGSNNEEILEEIRRRRTVDLDLRGREQERGTLVAESCYDQHGYVAGCHMTHPLVTASGRSMQRQDRDGWWMSAEQREGGSAWEYPAVGMWYHQYEQWAGNSMSSLLGPMVGGEASKMGMVRLNNLTIITTSPKAWVKYSQLRVGCWCTRGSIRRLLVHRHQSRVGNMQVVHKWRKWLDIGERQGGDIWEGTLIVFLLHSISMLIGLGYSYREVLAYTGLMVWLHGLTRR